MHRFQMKHRRLRLRTLFWFQIIPVLVVTVSLTFLGQGLGRANAELMARQQGVHAVDSIIARLTDPRQAAQLFGPLPPEEPILAKGLIEHDIPGLQDVLMQLTRIGRFSDVALYDVLGREQIRLGATDWDEYGTPLVLESLQGPTRSAVIATRLGLTMLYANPIRLRDVVVGVLMVGTRLELKDLSGPDQVDLAVIQGGRLTDSTAAGHAALPVILPGGLFNEQELDRINRSLAASKYQAVAKPLGGGWLMALVPMQDLIAAATTRTWGMIGGTLLLALGLLLIGFVAARAIAAPLEAMEEAASEIVRGNYQKRLARSQIAELDHVAASVNRMAEQVEAQVAELAHQAFHDTLTGLPNRSLFRDRLQRALARADRHGRSVAVLFLDLDNFKFLNDSLGHGAGDRLLVAVADRLRARVAAEDTAARIGGDEFTVLLEEAGDPAATIRWADQLLSDLQAPFLIEGHEVYTTASIGIALSTPYQDGPDTLMKNADAAMYRAKTAGKARCQVFDPSMNAQARARLSLETDMHKALERGEFVVHYQPIIHLKTGKLTGAEALVRWAHPGHGLIPPGEFIPLAEETGLILPLGLWVLEEACRQMRAWQETFPTEPPLYVAVNLSARQFGHPGLADDIAQVLERTGLAPASLKLEMTESVMMQSAEATVGMLRRLKSLGIQLAVDDFGTGYSSLAYLKRFPIDVLKIDRSFVDRISQDAEDAAIVRAVIQLAKSLNLSVTAEGIETGEQLDFLRQMGCDYGQGYLMARPLTTEAVGAYLASQDPKSAAK